MWCMYCRQELDDDAGHCTRCGKGTGVEAAPPPADEAWLPAGLSEADREKYVRAHGWQATCPTLNAEEGRCGGKTYDASDIKCDICGGELIAVLRSPVPPSPSSRDYHIFEFHCVHCFGSRPCLDCPEDGTDIDGPFIKVPIRLKQQRLRASDAFATLLGTMMFLSFGLIAANLVLIWMLAMVACAVVGAILLAYFSVSWIRSPSKGPDVFELTPLKTFHDSDIWIFDYVKVLDMLKRKLNS